jgi:hypothetical protein
MDERLPIELRYSRLPWSPDLEHQSPAPAPNDSWAALVGTLEWSLCAHQDAPDDPPAFLLGLRDLGADEDVSPFFRAYPSIHDAVVAAEAAHDLLLEQLRRRLLGQP